MNVWEGILILAAFAGNSTIWIALFNNMHSRRLVLWAVHGTSRLSYVALVAVPVAYTYWYVGGHAPLYNVHAREGLTLATGYLVICWLAIIPPIVSRILRIWDHRGQPVRSNHVTSQDMLAKLGDRYDGDPRTTRIARLPGNQILQLSVHDMEIEIPRLSDELDGVSIAHLSDFHFTGAIGKAYFEDIVDQTLAMQPDLIAITGDLVDRNHCFDWINDTFGRLTAPAGVYYILGNHDELVDVAELHRRLAAHELVNVGGRWQEISLRESRVIIAGNELPWFYPAADLDSAPARNVDGEPLRILLAHTPDQFYWAQTHDVDLMLAGHTHGGQFRFPLVGAIVTPCRSGTRFAMGTYYRRPTVMHVGRGLSGTTPVRINCPPELTRIVLRKPE